MNDKPKAPRNSTPLTPEQVLKDARQRRATFDARVEDHKRIAEEAIREVDAKRLSDRVARVPDDDRVDCVKMLAAIGIIVPTIDAEYEDPAVDGDDGAPDDENNEDSDAGVEYGTMPHDAQGAGDKHAARTQRDGG